MITIPCAVANEYFRRQISFFEFQHLKVYGDDARKKAIIPIVKRNYVNQTKFESVKWNLQVPFKMVESILDIYNLDNDIYIPTNVFTAAKQVIGNLADDEIVEIIDADMVHLKKYDGYIPKKNEVICSDLYEDWHLKTSNPNKDNFKVIAPHLKHGDFKYMNGGFNLISRVDTLKKIIDETILIGMKIGKEQEGNQFSWWQTMFSLNVACHNSRVKMISLDNCYYPGVNEINEKQHLAHYCCDSIFNKRNMEAINVNDFPNNKFYKAAKEWLKTVSF